MEPLNIKNENPLHIPEGIQMLRQSMSSNVHGGGAFVLGIDFLDSVIERLAAFDLVPDGVIQSPVDRVSRDKYPEAKSFDTLYALNDITVIVGFTWNRNAAFLREMCDAANIRAIYILEGTQYSYRMMFEPDKRLFLEPKLQFLDECYPTLLQEKRNISYDYFTSHFREFEQTYLWLADDWSRETMTAYLEGHINLRTLPMSEVRDKSPQYFASDIIKLSSQETFVDCGGYDGDTVLEFVRQSSGNFRKIYVLEPDREMLPKLNENIAFLRNCMILNKGAFNKNGTISFGVSNGCGTIVSDCGAICDEDADNAIETVRLDDVIQDEISFLKMDIEGAELEALEGAKNLIVKYHPTLAICVYHKRGDLIRIPQLIRSYYEGYELYLRGYFYNASEVVLYAVPREK